MATVCSEVCSEDPPAKEETTRVGTLIVATIY